MKTKRSWRILTLLPVLVLAGCASLPPVSNFQSQYNFVVRGNVTEDQVKTLDYILGRLPPAMIASIREIAVQPPEHFGHGQIAHFGNPLCGPIICLQPNNVNDSATVWHETGHAYQRQLDVDREDYSEGFTAKWINLAGDVYVGVDNYGEQPPSEYPRRGLLTPYASSNNREDLAEWVENVYCFLTDRNSAIAALKENGDFHKDARYAKKLQLLNQYGFLNDEDYRKVLDFLK